MKMKECSMKTLKPSKMMIEKLNIILTKISFIVVLSSIPAGFFSVFQSITGWYFDNAWFMSFVAIAIFIDHAVGSYVHWKIKKDFNWKQNRDGLYTKVFGSIAGYILFEMFYQIVEDVHFIGMYLKILLQVATFAYPAMSALVNISLATNGNYPPKGILKRFIKFEETGDLEAFKTISDEDKNNSVIDTDDNNSDELQEPKEGS